MWWNRDWVVRGVALLVVVGVAVFYMVYSHVLSTAFLWVVAGMVLAGGVAFLYVVYERLMGGVDLPRR